MVVANSAWIESSLLGEVPCCNYRMERFLESISDRYVLYERYVYFFLLFFLKAKDMLYSFLFFIRIIIYELLYKWLSILLLLVQFFFSLLLHIILSALLNIMFPLLSVISLSYICSLWFFFSFTICLYDWKYKDHRLC